MDSTLQRHAAKCIYIVPDGLKELISDISREVLRNQPQNIYTFIADYLEALLFTRENARLAARLIQSVTEVAETTIEFLQKTGMDKSQVEKVVGVMNEKFKRKILDEHKAASLEQSKQVDEANMVTDIINDADLDIDEIKDSIPIIQSAYRKFKHRKEAEKLLTSGMIDWRIAARSALKLYRQTGVTNEEASRAATLIKAAYKGYYTRRIMKTLTEEQKILTAPLSETDQEAFAEETSSLTSKDIKNVTIDYDTVIPHVDFGDVTDLESTPVIVAYILDNVLKMVEQKERRRSKKESIASGRGSQGEGRGSQASKRPSDIKSTASTRRSKESHASYKERGSHVSGRSSHVPEVGSQVSRGSHASHKSYKSHVSYASGQSYVSKQGSHVSKRDSHVSERSSHVSHESYKSDESHKSRGSSVSEKSHISERGSQVSKHDSHVSERSSHVSHESYKSRGSSVSEKSHVSEQSSNVLEHASQVSETFSFVSERGDPVSA